MPRVCQWRFNFWGNTPGDKRVTQKRELRVTLPAHRREIIFEVSELAKHNGFTGPWRFIDVARSITRVLVEAGGRCQHCTVLPSYQRYFRIVETGMHTTVADSPLSMSSRLALGLAVGFLRRSDSRGSIDRKSQARAYARESPISPYALSDNPRKP